MNSTNKQIMDKLETLKRERWQDAISRGMREPQLRDEMNAAAITIENAFERVAAWMEDKLLNEMVAVKSSSLYRADDNDGMEASIDYFVVNMKSIVREIAAD